MARRESEVRTPGARGPEDEALALVQRGDARAALVVLMRAYGDAIYRFCLEQTADAAAAEDLLQTVFVQAHQALPRYEHRTSLRAWLYGIARHRCMDAVESRRRWLKVVRDDGEVPEVPDRAASAEASVALGQSRAALDDCLQALPPKVRETVLLRFRGELSYEELAEASGEKLVTLRVRVARALPLLRRCLEAKGVAA